MVICIIGAGASGMAAAIEAAKNPANRVLLLERQARVGRKLQATGNGRCNLSNQNAGLPHYHGEQADFVLPALSRYDVTNTLDWFTGLGLVTATEDSGKIYPYSDQANSVVDVLRFGLIRENIAFYPGFEVTKVQKETNGFNIYGSEVLHCDKLIIACGGLAGSKLGGSMSGYTLLRSFGHKSTRLRPSLVQIKSSFPGIASLKGVRANCHVEILHKNTHFAESCGELQFTEFGLSGPVIFEISRDVCSSLGGWIAKLDFLPQLSEDAVFSLLKRKQRSSLTCEDLFTGILHNRLGRVLIQTAGLRNQLPVSELSDEQLLAAARLAKELEIPLTEPLGMDNAQVTAGGILTKDFDPNTMESRLVPGLYACGEVLDIDGDCGGYNLQWAWSSGRTAGSAAGGSL